MSRWVRSFPARPLLGVLAAWCMLGAASEAAADAGVARHGAAVSAANALIAEVRVALDRAARVYVEYDNPQAGRYRTALSGPGAEHVIPIVRLRPQTTYDYTIFVVDGAADAEGAAAGPGGSFTTGALPPLLAAMPVRVRGRSSQPLILSDYLRGDLESYFVFWDETGAVVWYYHEPPPFRAFAIKQLPGGNLLHLQRGRLTEITPLGEVVNRYRPGGAWGTPHHDFAFLGDGRMIYPSWEHVVIDDTANGGAAESTFVVDDLRVRDPESGRIEKVWDAREAWDMRDPDQRVARPARNDGLFRWTLVNSVSIGPRGNAILSSRGRNQVVSLSPGFRTIEWQLHGPDSDFEFPNPADRFYGQHTAAQLANGNVLLFDNGLQRPEAEGGEYSRALELRLDTAAGTAAKVWEYRLTPDLFSPGGGSAYRLSNGNTLVTFSTSSVQTRFHHAPLTVAEVDPAGNEVFRFDNLPWPHAAAHSPMRYRAAGGMSAIMGETMLRPPGAAPAPEHAEMVAGSFTLALDPDRFRELEAAVDGAQRIAGGGGIDLFLADGRLLYAKEPCAYEDVAERFFLHVLPAGREDSASWEGFENLDFWFTDHGQRWQGACLAAVTLPDYAIARIRTGQFVSGQGQRWSVEFPAS